MNPKRRKWLLQLAGLAGLASAGSATSAQAADTVQRGRPITFPRDHGAHLGARIEWWYATGWLSPGDDSAPRGKVAEVAEVDKVDEVGMAGLQGFQITFFRSRTGLAADVPGRFAPRHILFAHAAVTDLRTDAATGRHRHDQRLLRWSEDPTAATGAASVADAAVHTGNWWLRRQGDLPAGRWQASLPARDFAIELQLTETQPPLLQGDAGFSRKGPQERQASHYYSLPQLQARGRLQSQGAASSGRAWLDHEWSDEILHPEAVGWDWIGMNLFDGSALTAFVLRRADGSALWAGGSFRAGQPGAASRSFEAGEVVWTAGRIWRSPDTGARYPVEWLVSTPAGSFSVRALADAQELDSRGSTGSVYWEGLSELLDASGDRIGLGYLEMTGYAGRLRMS